MHVLLHKLFGVILRNLFIFLGPIYIKLGQVMSYDYPSLKELYTLQDDCGPISKKYLKTIQMKYPELEISDIYLSSGSIAAVHMCKYNDIDCVVKIKRPNIKRQIQSNINQICFMIDNFLHFFINIGFCNLKRKLKKAISLYEIQYDFKNEVNNWKEYNNIFNNLKWIIIPKIFEEISNDEIIVMEYIPGYNIVKDKEMLIQEEEILVNAYKRIVGIFMTSMINNIYHGDLHPGNFSFTEKGEIIIYDFGICFDFNDDSIDNNFLLDIMDAYYTRDSYWVIKLIIDNFTGLTENDKIYIIHELNNNETVRKQCYDIFRDQTEYCFMSLFKTIKKVFNDYNIVINDTMIQTEFILVSLISSFDTLRHMISNTSVSLNEVRFDALLNNYYK